jgi:hypothetical protein
MTGPTSTGLEQPYRPPLGSCQTPTTVLPDSVARCSRSRRYALSSVSTDDRRRSMSASRASLTWPYLSGPRRRDKLRPVAGLGRSGSVVSFILRHSSESLPWSAVGRGVRYYRRHRRPPELRALCGASRRPSAGRQYRLDQYLRLRSCRAYRQLPSCQDRRLS